MADLDDLVEAVVDIEDIVEEVADPEDLIEDFLDEPLMTFFAIVAGFAAIVALLLFLLTVTLLLVAVGPVEVIAFLTVLSFLTVALSLGAFLYVRTDIPSHVRRKINDALEEADETPNQDESMSEKEAVTELKDQYAQGNIDDHELDQALEEALTTDRPEKVVDRYK